MDYKWYAALAYVRANRLNHNVIEGPNDRFGIIAARQGLQRHAPGAARPRPRRRDLPPHRHPAAQGQRGVAARGDDHARVRAGPAGDPGRRGKAPGHRVPAEGRALQLAADVRPNVLGKFDETEGDDSGGEWSQANPAQTGCCARRPTSRRRSSPRRSPSGSTKLGVDADVARAHGDAHRADRSQGAEPRRARRAGAEQPVERTPCFCSGCPHNTSTKVPEGSRAVAGIGCHYMTVWMDRSTTTFSQMGGEGVAWIGQAPFTTDKHVFANLGDGTYFHSGPARDAPERSRPRSTSPTRSSSTTRSR